MLSSMHPTKVSLIKSTIILLESKSPEEITSEDVLQHSKISKGSLYHHFADFSELLEVAEVYLFSRYVDQSVESINMILMNSKSATEALNTLKGLARSTQTPEFHRLRYQRAMAISKSIRNERMHKLLSVEQLRLTEALADLIREFQERNWANKILDPYVVAVFIQSYPIGQVIDLFTPVKVNEDHWFKLIDRVLEKVLFRVEM